MGGDGRQAGVGVPDARQAARWVARVRVGIGLATCLAPGPVLRAGLGTRPDDRGLLVARMAGARDAILGAGAAIALGERRHSASWVSMGALVDAADAWWCLTGPRLGWRARLVGVTAAAAAVAGILLARALAVEEGDVEGASAVGVPG
jgi:hypothetical protein